MNRDTELMSAAGVWCVCGWVGVGMCVCGGGGVSEGPLVDWLSFARWAHPCEDAESCRYPVEDILQQVRCKDVNRAMRVNPPGGKGA